MASKAGELRVVVAENGFIVYESAGECLMGKSWAFESPSSLAEFMKEWGEEKAKTKLSN